MIPFSFQLITGGSQGKKRGFAQCHLGGTPELITGRAKPLLFLESIMKLEWHDKARNVKVLEWIETITGCWEIAPSRGHRYPMIRRMRRSLRVSRFIWEECFGEIPNGMGVCHKCDNTSCINPEHLFLGNQHDNVMDAVAKGRWYKTYLTDDAVRDIRQGTNYRVLMHRYGIPKHTISNIKRGRSYAWLN